jgi:hypothetical protein
MMRGKSPPAVEPIVSTYPLSRGLFPATPVAPVSPFALSPKVTWFFKHGIYRPQKAYSGILCSLEVFYMPPALDIHIVPLCGSGGFVAQDPICCIARVGGQANAKTYIIKNDGAVCRQVYDNAAKLVAWAYLHIGFAAQRPSFLFEGGATPLCASAKQSRFARFVVRRYPHFSGARFVHSLPKWVIPLRRTSTNAHSPTRPSRGRG